MDIKSAIIFATDKFKEKSIASARLDAEVLLLQSLNAGRGGKKDKSWMYLNIDEYALSPAEEKRFKGFVARRERHEPVAYIIGRKEFYGSDFFVNKDVLIPRPETEIIVEEALKLIKGRKKRFALMDIGTGSGCIPISILKAADAAGVSDRITEVYADDISKSALEIAKLNARRHKAASKISFLNLDLEDALEKARGARDLIITANLPYVSPEDYGKLAPNVRSYEPKIAITTKDSGLYHIKRLIGKFAAISSGMESYHIFLEADPGQMRSIASLAKKKLPEADIKMVKDLRGKKRVMEICEG